MKKEEKKPLDIKKFGVNPPRKENLSKEHLAVLYSFVMHIAGSVSPLINYDHLEMPVVKYPIPLKHRKKDYDISFILNDRIVYVDIETEKLPLQQLKVLKEHAEDRK